MKIFISIALLLYAFVGIAQEQKTLISSDCICQIKDSNKEKKIPLYGKVKIVKAFADFKVEVVNNFEDLSVELVNNFPISCGKWQIVDNFEDFTIEIVTNFPDFKIRYVDHFPGLKSK